VLHGDRKPPSVSLVTALVLRRRICIVGECPRGCGGRAPFHHPVKRNNLARRASRRALTLSRGSSPRRRYSRYEVCQFGFGMTPFRSPSMRRASPSAAEGTSGWAEVSSGSGASSSLTDGRCMFLQKMFGGTVVRPDAILASSSAVSLYRRAIWLSSSPWNLTSKRNRPPSFDCGSGSSS
jgi:hypothetical protein